MTWRSCAVIDEKIKDNRTENAPQNHVHIAWDILYGRVCQMLVSRAGTSNYIPYLLWDVITFPRPCYLLLAHKPSFVLGASVWFLGNGGFVALCNKCGNPDVSADRYHRRYIWIFVQIRHYDVMAWKHFAHRWALWRNPLGSGGFPSQT